MPEGIREPQFEEELASEAYTDAAQEDPSTVFKITKQQKQKQDLH